MREITDDARLRALMRALGAAARVETTVYFVGGATAVLNGWRSSTKDADIKVLPESDDMLRAIPGIKEALRINVEFAAPDDFLPPLPGWQERSPFIAKEGTVVFRHYDFYAQALAKLERGHRQDLEDVRSMRRAGLIEMDRLRELHGAIEPLLYRYPAVDPPTLRKAVSAFAAEAP
ncbi:MAG: hypothetical protein HY928_07670 [Elusimicrobia bacterium]|nr:hypothetical protein [Elusimicrobiota bacterium]